MAHKTFVNPFDGKLIRHPQHSGTGGLVITAFVKEKFAASNGQSVFTLASAPISDSEIVTRNGQVLDEGINDDYTISGAVITLNADVADTIVAGERIAVSYAI